MEHSFNPYKQKLLALLPRNIQKYSSFGFFGILIRRERQEW